MGSAEESLLANHVWAICQSVQPRRKEHKLYKR
jgi:hypothetical protein